MLPRSVLCLSASVLLFLGTAWCGPEPVPAAKRGSNKAEDREAESSAIVHSSAHRVSSPTTGPSVSDRDEHEPLALFSLGSLAVGGAFYAIHLSTRKSNSGFSAADRASLTNAMGAAGITALLAAGSYFWFTREGAYQEHESEPDWKARVCGGVDPDGEMSVGAMVTLPLSFLTP
ncbi:MAG: hypothetical protein ABIW76_10905 [Fibrobacteria bacterium]